MPALRQVLIGESNAAVRALLARVVASTYPTVTITTAVDGAAVLSIYETTGADLLILTHRLPILSGLQVVRALRTQGARLPILVISSDPLENAARHAGADRFLRKPFALKEIRLLLVELLPLEAEI